MSTVRGKRGILVVAPMGSGKTYWINQLPEAERSKWLDGDSLLEEAGITNRNNYWYQDGRDRFQLQVKELFGQWMTTGHNIFYSPNPFKLKGDALVLPDLLKRSKFLENRGREGGFQPSVEQFNREQDVYQRAATIGAYTWVIQSDIPSLAEMKELQARLGNSPLPF